jgi:membrane-associated phospholipid phosphatase
MVLTAQAISASVYLLVPSTFPRPTAADLTGWGITRRAVEWFWTIDPPNNTFPSTHVAISTVAALCMWRDRHPLKWLGLAFTVGVFVTVHTAKQHYWMDAVVGVLVGLGAYRGVLRLWCLPDGPGLDRQPGGGELGDTYRSRQEAILDDPGPTGDGRSQA